MIIPAAVVCLAAETENVIDGTVIGLDTAGGQTAYNADVAQCTLRSANPKAITVFWESFLRFFEKIFNWIKNLFGVN